MKPSLKYDGLIEIWFQFLDAGKLIRFLAPNIRSPFLISCSMMKNLVQLSLCISARIARTSPAVQLVGRNNTIKMEYLKQDIVTLLYFTEAPSVPHQHEAFIFSLS